MEIRLFFFCLYSNQEIRLTDVSLLLMATSSHHFFFTVSLSLSLLAPSPVSVHLRKEGNFHIESHPASGDLDLTPSQSPAWKMRMYSCVLDQVHHTDVNSFASWKCREIAVYYCWQTGCVENSLSAGFLKTCHYFWYTWKKHFFLKRRKKGKYKISINSAAINLSN